MALIRKRGLVWSVAPLLLLIGSSRSSLQAKELPQNVAKFFGSYCLSCHDNTTKEAAFSLEALSPEFEKAELLKAWMRVHDRLAESKMPPEDAPQPSEAERAVVTRWLHHELETASLAKQQATGRVGLRRLNRNEYESTLRDLLGIYVDVKDLLPDDSTVAGFDTVSEGLEISPVHLVRYQQAAEKAIETAIPWRPDGKIKARVTGKEHASGSAKITLEHAAKLRGDTIVYFANSTRHLTIRAERAPRPGKYRVRASIKAEGTNGKPLPVLFALVDKRPIESEKLEDVLKIFDAPTDKPRVVEFDVDLHEGDQVFIWGWTLPYYTSKEFKEKLAETSLDKMTGPALAVDWFEVEGPLEPWPSVGYQRMFGDLRLSTRRLEKQEITPEIAAKRHPNEWNKDPFYPVTENPEADAERLVRDFLPRAFRRPVSDEVAEPYVQFALERLKRGYTFLDAMKATYKSILCSPWFLYRVEKPGKLDDYALANRLSYFLWSSLPDEQLWDLAVSGKLHEPAVLHAQVERMLKDPKATRFTTNFTGQWLDLRKLHMTKPDRMYPEWDLHLLWSMPEETIAFFNEVLRTDASLLEFVDSDWSMLNERLAHHYGIENVHGFEPRRVNLPAETQRGGVMTQAVVLKVTANGTTTSPISRGAWVLERILGQPPSPPPPNLPAIEPDIRGATTIRQQLEKHRNVEACATCHKSIDPPGFALETFDVIGGWRDRYRSNTGGEGHTYEELKRYPGKKVWLSQEVEQGYVTPSGEPFANTAEYKQILLSNPDQIARNLTRKLLIYSTGADIQFADRQVVEEIVSRMKQKNYGFRTLIHEIVSSRPFLTK